MSEHYRELKQRLDALKCEYGGTRDIERLADEMTSSDDDFLSLLGKHLRSSCDGEDATFHVVPLVSALLEWKIAEPCRT